MKEVLLYILNIIGEWKLFEKSGEDNWKAVIPVYHKYICCKLADCVYLFVIEIILYAVAFIVVIALSLTDALFLSAGLLDTELADIIAAAGSGGIALIASILSGIYLIIFTIINVTINLKLVSCYTDDTAIKVLAGLGGFPPIYFLGVLARCILGFDNKYQYRNYRF